MFSCNTSNSSLRGHIINWHLEEYLELAEQNGWVVQLSAVQSAFSMGYTFKTLREAIQQGNKIAALPPAPRPGHGDSLPGNLLPSGTEKSTSAFPEFSNAALHEYLVKFVVADDQV